MLQIWSPGLALPVQAGLGLQEPSPLQGAAWTVRNGFLEGDTKLDVEGVTLQTCGLAKTPVFPENTVPDLDHGDEFPSRAGPYGFRYLWL